MRHSFALAGLLLGGLGCLGTSQARSPGAATVRSEPTGQPRYGIAYRIAMPDPASHLYEVQLDVDGVRGDTLRLQLPVWSPGRYARYDFARNVQDFVATGGASAEGVAAGEGKALAWDKENGSLWRVYPAGARHVTVRYRVFANAISGTTSVLDTAHANWNGAGIFFYVVGHKPDSVTLRVTPPAGWQVMNGDARTGEQRDFAFADYDHLVDTPTEVAPRFTVDSFRVDGRLYRVMVHHNGDDHGLRPTFVRALERIVRTENRVIAPPPLERYTFLFNVGFGGGDGMEHLYSTEIIVPTAWTDSASLRTAIDDASHEYFHTWNVKRIRPAALGPFDYTREQYEPSLWVAEGWTQYYGDMTMFRAANEPKDELYGTLAGMIRYVSEIPGARQTSARMASFDAPFWDGPRPPYPTNRDAHWVTYYYKGEALALLLDLELRARTGNRRSLDDVLRLLRDRTWNAPSASYYLQGRGYTEADVERAVSDVAGSDFHPWFERYVGGTEPLPWRETLALAGLTLERRDAGAGREYVLGEAADATAEQRLVRDGWLRGTTAQ